LVGNDQLGQISRARHLGVARSAMDIVIVGQQLLREICAILAGDPTNQRSLQYVSLSRPEAPKYVPIQDSLDPRTDAEEQVNDWHDNDPKVAFNGELAADQKSWLEKIFFG